MIEILRIVCPDYIEDKLHAKHNVSVLEARQVIVNEPRIRFAEKGNVEDEDVYAAFSRTYGGRYLVVFFVYKPNQSTAIIISARDMTHKERRTYATK